MSKKYPKSSLPQKIANPHLAAHRNNARRRGQEKQNNMPTKTKARDSRTQLEKDCERVNQLLKLEAVRLKLGTKNSLKRLDDARELSNITYSYWAKMEFQEFVRRQLEKQPTVDSDDLTYLVASVLRISSETVKRYVSVIRKGAGPFRCIGKMVMLNENYTGDEYFTDPEPEPADGEA